MPTEPADLDRLQKEYKDAVERWITVIREEESLATPDHSVAAWDRWEEAGFQADEARKRAHLAREAYKDALRARDYNF